MAHTVSLRTDPRAYAMWDNNRRLVAIMAELCDPDMPPPMETLFVRDKRSRVPQTPEVVLEKRVEEKITLVNSIIEHGLDPMDCIHVRTRLLPNDQEVFEFVDGTHRACILLALGQPIPAINMGRVEVDRDLYQAMLGHPLTKYPLNEEIE